MSINFLKVQVFWEGHKNLVNLHHGFDITKTAADLINFWKIVISKILRPTPLLVSEKNCHLHSYMVLHAYLAGESSKLHTK